MRLPMRAGVAVATLALSAAPLAGGSHAADAPSLAADDSAAGCVTTWTSEGGLGQWEIETQRFIDSTAHVDPDLSVHVYPMTPVGAAAFIATHSAGRVLVLVNCIV